MHPTSSNTMDSKSPRIGIIGAGMSGMLMAIKLLQRSDTNFVVFEKAHKVGGTWRENRYPGVACDVASFAYCYEFEPNPNWSKRFSGGGEIQQYFENVAEKYHLDKYIKFHTTVTKAQFTDNQWHVNTSNNESYTFDILVDATGPLNEKIYPNIKGIDSFKGVMCHTADWADDYDYTGKKVGIIGSGSSGVQATWPIAQKAEHLTAFIRTPQWIMPTANPEYSPLSKKLKQKIPLLGWLTRKFYDWVGEQFGQAALKDGLRRKFIAKACEHNLNSIKDEKLREKMRPDFQAMCKRMIVSDVYYKALQQSNVTVERTGIECIEANGVRTTDGKLHPLDFIVLATGFHPNIWGIKEIIGLNGLTIKEAWKDEPSRNYLSMGVPGFPNFFTLIGTNSPITNLSLIDIADIGVEYILQCVDKITAGEFSVMSPKKSAATAFGNELLTSFDDTIWVSGCSSWYFDGSSVPQTWPWSPAHFKERLKTPNLNDYELS